MTIYKTNWGADTVEISADFTVFNAEVAGTDGKLVGDFNGIPSRAMRYALKQAVRADGRDPDRFIVECEIETAIELMEACDEDS